MQWQQDPCPATMAMNPCRSGCLGNVKVSRQLAPAVALAMLGLAWVLVQMFGRSAATTAWGVAHHVSPLVDARTLPIAPPSYPRPPHRAQHWSQGIARAVHPRSWALGSLPPRPSLLHLQGPQSHARHPASSARPTGLPTAPVIMSAGAAGLGLLLWRLHLRGRPARANEHTALCAFESSTSTSASAIPASSPAPTPSPNPSPSTSASPSASEPPPRPEAPPVPSKRTKPYRKRKRGKSKDPSISYSKPRKDSRESVVDFLSRRFPYHTREQWEALAHKGRVSVNGAPAAPATVLLTNDVVSYRGDGEEPVVDPRFEILHIDEHIVAVSKSGNIPVAEGGRYYRNVLVQVVQRHLAESSGTDEPLYQVHRLDRETSGTVLFARTLQAAQALGAQMVANTVQKVYYAVLVGVLTEEVDCRLPITRLHQVAAAGPDAVPHIHRIRMTCDDSGKSSHTRFTPICCAGGLTLCKVQLFSGRTHQIRVHAFSLGHPLLGDKLYGQTDRDFLAFTTGEKPAVFPPFGAAPRHLLHAATISFRHPVTQQPLTISSSYEGPFSECPYVEKHLMHDAACEWNPPEC